MTTGKEEESLSVLLVQNNPDQPLVRLILDCKDKDFIHKQRWVISGQ